ncbi:hypothetical protein [Catenulispora subtropica]|uniref:Uncharacterized protein n=1 Tax=Catenulispora subtropica TaxID=450798 RepID=A0ABP5C2A9_9ACTN
MSTAGEPPASEGAGGDSGGWDWFGGGAEPEAGEPGADGPVDRGAAGDLGVVASAELSAEPSAELSTELGTEPSTEPATDSFPEPTGRARFRVLTGGRAASGGSEPEPPVTVDDSSTTESADFRVRCPDCGPQFVKVADVRFVSTGGGADTDRYLFTCPSCGIRVRRPAGPELAAILKTSGVATLALRRGPDQAL